MRLLVFHRILIATMVAFLGYFGWWQAVQWRADGSWTALAMAVASGVVAIALTLYLTNLRRFVRIDETRREEPR
jgi:hypothetical protein